MTSPAHGALYKKVTGFSGAGWDGDWDLQSVTESEQSKRSNAFCGIGNEKASNIYDKRVNVTATFKAVKNLTAAAAPALPLKIGELVGDVLLTSIQLNSTFNDFVTMVLSGHQHTDGTDGTDACKSVAHGITLTKGFGAQLFGTTAPTGGCVENSSLTIQCDHAEVADENGDNSCGENHNPRMELNATYIGGTSDPVQPTDWDLIEVAPATSNDGFDRVSLNAVKALAFADS